MVILVDLIGRLLLIERREALALGFDSAASIGAFSDHASDSVSHADPRYGTFTMEAGLPVERGQQAVHTSVIRESGSTDNLLDRESSIHGAMKLHTRDPIPFLQVIRALFTSRAVAAVLNSLVYGYVA